MFYPDDLFQTKHCHCCWLCRTCHVAFHRRVKGVLSFPKKTWAGLLKHTKKIVLRELRKPTIQMPQHLLKTRALSNFTGIVVIPPSELKALPLEMHASFQRVEIVQALKKAKEVQ